MIKIIFYRSGAFRRRKRLAQNRYKLFFFSANRIFLRFPIPSCDINAHLNKVKNPTISRRPYRVMYVQSPGTFPDAQQYRQRVNQRVLVPSINVLASFMTVTIAELIRNLYVPRYASVPFSHRVLSLVNFKRNLAIAYTGERIFRRKTRSRRKRVKKASYLRSPQSSSPILFVARRSGTVVTATPRTGRTRTRQRARLRLCLRGFTCTTVGLWAIHRARVRAFGPRTEDTSSLPVRRVTLLPPRQTAIVRRVVY